MYILEPFSFKLETTTAGAYVGRDLQYYSIQTTCNRGISPLGSDDLDSQYMQAEKDRD